MIMKTLRYIALAALTLSFAACTQEEDFTPQMDGDAVKINATIGALQTRVAYSGDNGVTNFVNGDAIKVENLMRTSKNEATYTTTDGTNWTTTDAMVWNSTSKNKFQAYYPVAEYSSYDMFTIPTDQSDATKLASADWMTASTGEIEKPGNGVLDLNFQHRLAKVTVNLTFSSQYPEGYQHVSDFTFYTNEETQQAITPLANSETSYTAILRPGEYADESYFIYLTMDGIEEHDVLGKTTTAAINLEAGKHYTFTLKVGKDVVSIDDVTVADWNEEDIDGGVAEEEVYPNIINATAMDATALNEAVVNALELEYTDLTVTLAAEPESEMYAAIRRALIDTEGVVDGSINLTLKGATVMPDHSIELQDGSIAFGEIWQDENGETLNNPEQVLELHSISLPDMLTIGEGAFEGCGNLTSINAPKVQTIGKYALSKTALTSVEFPELKTITTNLLGSTNTLTSARFPKVTTIEHAGLMIGYSFNPESVSLELTAEDDITFNGNSHFNVESQNYSTKVDLVLHSNKQDEVTDGNQWKGYTFKSITFKD
nr:MAG TPA: Fimbrillin-like [Caudoviricetes sp.]DAQ76373.1 MAG TPA: Fimbrillin-like [Caudoviricetes sp.]